MSDEKKAARKERIRIAFATSEKRRAAVELTKTERLGAGNPNSVGVYWDGMSFGSLGEFECYARSQGFNLRECRAVLKLGTDPNKRRIHKESKKEKIPIKMTCVHCLKTITSSNSSAFNRWHNDNCKMKEIQNGN